MDEVYVGLDVSDKSTHLCVVDGAGAVKRGTLKRGTRTV